MMRWVTGKYLLLPVGINAAQASAGGHSYRLGYR
jgi:hypothetical protein